MIGDLKIVAESLQLEVAEDVSSRELLRNIPGKFDGYEEEQFGAT